MGRKQILLWIPALLAAVCGILCWGASLQIRQGSGFLFIPSFTATLTSTLTPTETLMATPVPTDTPVPTETPLPTATLTPTPTNSPVPTTDPAVIRAEVWQQVTETAMQEILLMTPSATPTIPDSELRTGLQMTDQKSGLSLIYIRENDASAPVSQGFWMASAEISSAGYNLCAAEGKCPHLAGIGADLPLTGIQFKEAEQYCRWAEMELPALADYETAAVDWVPDGETDNFGFQSDGPVMDDDPNRIAFLYGNVWEWTAERALFGGSWKTAPQDLPQRRVAAADPSAEMDDVGFRCIRRVPCD